MRSVLRWLILGGASVMLTLAAGATQPEQDAARAQELLTLARTALGGEAQLNALHSLSISGTTRRTMGMGQLESELSIDLQMPEKYRKSETKSPIRFSNYKPTGGILFPRKVTRTTGERVSEEREYSKFKMNPELKPERFKKKAQKPEVRRCESRKS